MPFNGSGVFTRLYNWANDAAASIKIRADRFDAEMDGFATGLSTCMTKDGQQLPTAAQNFNGQNLTNVGTMSATSVVGTTVSSVSSSVSAAASTATTLFTISNVNNSTWLVSAQLQAADATNYSAYAVVSTQNATVRLLTNVAGPLLTISNSGLNIQGTQSSGITATIYYSAVRIM